MANFYTYMGGSVSFRLALEEGRRGSLLYCRIITMPGRGVDCINTNDLQQVQELVLAPNHALISNGTTSIL